MVAGREWKLQCIVNLENLKNCISSVADINSKFNLISNLIKSKALISRAVYFNKCNNSSS